MASPYWRRNFTLRQVLDQYADRIGFFQLVRVLLLSHTETAPMDVAEQLEKHLQFVADLEYDYPPGDVRAVHSTSDRKSKTQIKVTHLGLVGRKGPIPEPFWEWINDNVRNGDFALRDFIDLFNNKLIALQFIIKEQCHPTLSLKDPAASDVGKLLFCLTGNLSAEKRKLLKIPDSTLLAETASLADCRVTARSLRVLIERIPGVRIVRIRPFQGAWLRVDDNECSRLGRKGANQILGTSAALGRRVWDQQAGIDILMAPMSHDLFTRCLPGGDLHQRLVRSIRMMSDGEWDCKVSLQLLAQDLRSCHISSHSDPNANNRLGFCSWLKTSKEFSGKCHFMC